MNALEHARLQQLCNELPPESTIRSIIEVALAHGQEHPGEFAGPQNGPDEKDELED